MSENIRSKNRLDQTLPRRSLLIVDLAECRHNRTIQLPEWATPLRESFSKINCSRHEVNVRSLHACTDKNQPIKRTFKRELYCRTSLKGRSSGKSR